MVIEVAVLDYSTSEVDIYRHVEVDGDNINDDVEEFLKDKYGSLNSIYWMSADELIVNEHF